MAQDVAERHQCRVYAVGMPAVRAVEAAVLLHGTCNGGSRDRRGHCAVTAGQRFRETEDIGLEGEVL